eukprot:7934559-Pyramimonas_sp.AAC.1
MVTHKATSWLSKLLRPDPARNIRRRTAPKMRHSPVLPGNVRFCRGMSDFPGECPRRSTGMRQIIQDRLVCERHP